MPLDMEVGLGSGHIVLDGDTAALPPKWDKAPKFRSISTVAKRLGYSPQFSAMCTVAKRLPVSLAAKWLDGLRCHLVWR